MRSPWLHLSARSVWLGVLLLATGPATAQVLEEVARLVAGDDYKPALYFGESVAIDGDTAVIGAPNDTLRGSAFVFTRDAAGKWNLKQRLFGCGALPGSGDFIGASVAIDGDTIVVAAPFADDLGRNSGSACIFRADASGVWWEEAELLAGDGQGDDLFGESVSISGDTVVVGSRLNDGAAVDSGAAYVFRRGAAGWYQEAKLLASDAIGSEQFGSSVAIDGDTAVVGSVYTEPFGAAYVFVRNSSGKWHQQTKLSASKPDRYDYFGYEVAVAGDAVLVGAYGDDDLGTDSGAAYIFARDAAGTWREEAKLLASDGSAVDLFGTAVALDGDKALVGALFTDERVPDSGSAYVFTRNGDGSWQETAKLMASDAASSDQFAHAVALAGDSALVGAFDPPYPEQGSAYVFDLSGAPAASPFLTQCTANAVGGAAVFAAIRNDGFMSIKSLVPGSSPGSAFATVLSAAVDDVIAAEFLPDTNGNGAAEVAVLGETTFAVVDLLGGTLATGSLSAGSTASHLVVMQARLGAESPEPELVTIETDRSNPGWVFTRVRDARFRVLWNLALPGVYDFEVRDADVYPDVNDDGVPDLGLLLASTTGGSDRVRVSSVNTGSGSDFWFSAAYSHLLQVPLADPDVYGSARMALIRRHRLDGRVNIVLRATNPSLGIPTNTIGFDRKYPPTHFFALPDLNGNGDAELMAFGTHEDLGYQHAKIHDTSTGDQIDRVFFDRNVPASDVSLCPDLDGNGVPEIVMLGVKSDGVPRVIIKDAKTGERLFTNEFPFLQ